MKLTIYYRKSLDLKASQIAEQAVYAVIGFGVTETPDKIDVRSATDAHFINMVVEHDCFVQRSFCPLDSFYREDTCMVFYEER